MAAALSSLRTSGVSIVPEVVGQDLINDLKATDVFRSMPISMPARAGHAQSHAGKRREVHVASEEWRASAMGRLHRREETFNNEDIKVFERVEQLLWPLVMDFFCEDGEDGMHGIFRSEMQARPVPELIHAYFSQFHSTAAFMLRAPADSQCGAGIERSNMALR